MKPLNEMLRELSRPDVAEFAVVSERLPCVKVGQAYEPIDDAMCSTAAILEMLVASGGSRYVDQLEARPAQWTTRVDGVGVIAVTATMRAGRVQARFTLQRRAAPVALQEAPAKPEPFLGIEALAPAPARRAAVESPLDELLGAARDAGASDLHVVATRPMLLRVGGELTPRGAAIADCAVEAMIMPIVPPHVRATLAEHGSCDFALQGASGRFRVNVARQRTGLKACFRCIADGVPTLASLGLPPEMERATRHHQGLVLVTGPTGHGKTSTLAALVDIINRTTTRHIITVEDPVEFVHERRMAMVSQREVGTHTRSFQNALKAALREDPDVIVVGELRDTETVRMALTASETGHLVIGTMNTPNAAKTIDRLIDLFPPSDQQQVRMTLAGGLHLIVSQRLVPAANGASMVAAVELLPGSVALWSLIREGKTYQIPSLQQRGKGFGIVRLDDSLADLVRAGRITRATALAIAEGPEELDALLSGKQAQVSSAQLPGAARPEGQGILGRAGQLFGTPFGSGRDKAGERPGKGS